MSNSLAIATVSAVLAARVRALLDAAGLAEPAVTTEHPGPEADAGVYIHCYQLLPNADLRNVPLPERDATGRVHQRPQLPVDLHYLVSFVGDVATQEPELLAGLVLTDWHRAPLLSPAEIDELVTSLDAGHRLAASDLADQDVGIRLTPLSLDLEDLSRLWGMLGRDAHHLSVAYRVSAIVLEAAEVVGEALPVTARQLVTFPFGRPRLDRVRGTTTDQPVVPVGDELVVHGEALRGERTVLRLGDDRRTIDDATPTEIRLRFDGPSGLSAGVVAVQVIHEVVLPDGSVREAAASNTLPVALAPTVDGAVTVTAESEPVAGGEDRAYHEVTVPVDPAPGSAQPVEVLLTRDTEQVRVAGEVAGGDVIAEVEPRLAAGTWRVRVSVSGATSLMTTDADGHITGPSVVVP